MVQAMETMLELLDYPEGLMKEGARTMAETVNRFKQGMDELVQRGRRQGQAHVLRRQAERRFGAKTAGRLSEVLGEASGPEDIDRVTDALFDCATGEEFIRRVRTA